MVINMPEDSAMSIGAGDFKAHCLKLIDDVAQSRQPLIITKYGKPVAKLVPIEPRPDLFGALKGATYYEGDIISPIDVEWDAQT